MNKSHVHVFQTKLNNTFFESAIYVTTVPLENVTFLYNVAKRFSPSKTKAFLGHQLNLLLIFPGNRSAFLVKCPCAEITQLSSRVISLTSVQRSEL